MCEIDANFKEICDLLLIQNEFNRVDIEINFLFNLKLIIKSIEENYLSNNMQSQHQLYHLWSNILTKLNDYLKYLNKSSSIVTHTLDYEPIYMLLAFPFKYFQKLKLEQVKRIILAFKTRSFLTHFSL